MGKKRGGSNWITIVILSALAVLAALIATKGLAAGLNQKNITLNKEVEQLVSTNQWIKYQISDKILMDRIESTAKGSLGMGPASTDQIKYLAVDMKKINNPADGMKESNWLEKIRRNIGELFNGQGR